MTEAKIQALRYSVKCWKEKAELYERVANEFREALISIRGTKGFDPRTLDRESFINVMATDVAIASAVLKKTEKLYRDEGIK